MRILGQEMVSLIVRLSLRLGFNANKKIVSCLLVSLEQSLLALARKNLYPKKNSESVCIFFCIGRRRF